LSFLCAKDVKSIRFWYNLLTFRPHIFHFVPGPTLKGLLLVKIIQILTGSTTVVSATQPSLPKCKFFKKIIAPFLKADMVLVQSKESECLFNSINYPVKFIPNGVDTERFHPVSIKERNEIRKKHGFRAEDFIVLHVGPIKKGRNQKSLLGLKNVKLLLIVSTTNPSEKGAYDEFLETDAIILNKYIQKMEEIYEMSDVYIWPAFEKLHGIELPLSILEAMSCNLPVITTKYGAIDRVFRQDGEGLIFIDNETQIPEIILNIKKGVTRVNNREKVKAFSWKNIVDKIAITYEDLSQQHKQGSKR
jgi:glycosyltransferase involved in cell wall biosynthesis